MEHNRQDRLPWAIVLLIIVLCCAVAFAGSRIVNASRSAGAFASTRMLQVSGAQKLKVAGDGFVYYDGGSIAKISSEGESMWSYMVGADADFAVTDAGIAVFRFIIGIDARRVSDATYIRAQNSIVRYVQLRPNLCFYSSCTGRF